MGMQLPEGLEASDTDDPKSSSLGQYLDVEAQWYQAFAPLFERLRADPEDAEFCGATVCAYIPILRR